MFIMGMEDTACVPQYRHARGHLAGPSSPLHASTVMLSRMKLGLFGLVPVCLYLLSHWAGPKEH